MRKWLSMALCLMLLCLCCAGCAGEEAPESVTITTQFSLVVPKGTDVAVAEAANCIRSALHYKMNTPSVRLVDKDPGGKAIYFQVDEAMEPGAHKIELRSDSIYLTAQTPHVLLYITRQLRQLMLDNGNSPVVTQQMCAQLTGTTDVSRLPFRVLSQNILSKDVDGGNTVADRQPRFQELLQEYCPDVLAVQEHSGGWETFIPGKFGDIYTCYAQLGKALYFRTSRYDILEKGSFFLSPTPDVRSQFEGDSGPRSCIWAIVKDKLLDMEILYINCHPDWNNDTQRALQVDVIFDVMGEKMGKYPTIFCGDFNTEPTGPVYKRIVGQFKDAYAEAERNLSEVDHTCHLFGESSTFIDYTFYNHTFKPTLYRIISEMYNGHVSDHYGTFTDFALE